MLAINMDDVMNVLNNCRPYLIGFGVVPLPFALEVVTFKKMKKRS